MMKRKLPVFILTLILMLVIMTADSNNRIVCTEYDIVSDSVPNSFDGFKIVQLSDLHGKIFGKNNKKLLEAVSAQNPDIIAITGDIADKSGEIEYISLLVSQLSDIAPVYYVTGNHEWATGDIKEIFETVESSGGKKLRNTYDILERNGETIVIAGIDDPNGPRDMRTPQEVSERIKSACGDVFSLLLAHRNDPDLYENVDCDVILCGHAHGGIIRLPFIGALLGTNHKFFPEYAGGEYNIGSNKLIVSRGLGNANLIPRFLNNPEITVIILKRQ